MKYRWTFLFLALATFGAFAQVGQAVKVPQLGKSSVKEVIIPIPASIILEKGEFILTSGTKIVISSKDKSLLELAKYLSGQIETSCGFKLKIVSSNKAINNSIILNTSSLGKSESYSLKINPQTIHIDGVNQNGLFYGMQTLLQMINPGLTRSDKVVLNCVNIEDEPSFAWRGLHMDVARHFFSVEFVKRMIDMMSIYKLNTFHWHLTDDQGWRIEIKKYPKLTQIGSWREESLVGPLISDNLKFDGIPHAGFYTQEQIKEVVNYAKKRYIAIVPEIEMPGHCLAALAAYPELSCTGGPFKVATKWGIVDDVYCVGKEETFKFQENVLDEIMSLFPGKYIHIGGDECRKVRWKSCPDCQLRMKNEGMKSEAELQSYFVKRIEKYISSKGRKLIGWDEILNEELPKSTTVMAWRGYKGGIAAAESGHDVIMTPALFCYFDHSQSTDKGEPYSFGGNLTLEKVYSFYPIPSDLHEDAVKHILGAQANVWTEYIATEKHAEYMIFPRLFAMSEVLWSAKKDLNYPQFLNRVNVHLQRLQNKGINYRPLK